MDSSVGKDIRISNIFHTSGNAFIVALDHGILMGPIPGIENIEESVGNIVKGNPDAIQVTPPVAKILKHNFLGRNSPSLVVRLDTSNLWRKTPAPKQGYYSDIFSVKDAVKLDADAIVTYLLLGFDDDSQEKDNMKVLSNISKEAADYGIPLIIEPLPVTGDDYGKNSNNAEIIKLGARMSCELGADLLKLDYTGDTNTFSDIVNSSFVPCLVRGGPKTETIEDTLKIISDSLDSGAKGIVFGRNVWQSDNTTKTTSTLSKLVHGEIDISQALDSL